MKKMDCFKAMRIGNIMFYGGLVVIMIGIVIKDVSLNPDKTFPLILAIGGAVVVFFGLLLGALRIVCPHCGKSLVSGKLLPRSLPPACPFCGGPLKDPRVSE